MRFPQATFASSSGPAATGRMSRQLARAYAAGSLVRLRRGVYLETDEWLSGTAADRYAITTASLAVGAQAPVLCRETALLAWGLELPRTPTHVRYRTDRPAAVGTVPARGLYGDADEAQRRWLVRPDRHGRPLPQGFPDARHYGIPSPAVPLFLPHLGRSLLLEPFDAAFIDTVHRLSFADGVVLADGVLAHRPDLKAGPRSRDDLRRLCAAMANRSAQARLARVLDFADGASESVGESLSRALMWELGFEVPRLQVWISRDGRRIARVDYLWERIRLTGEFDGLQKYVRSREFSGKSPAQVVVEEKRREDEVRSAGYGMVRWIWDDLLEPARFAAILHRAGVPRRR
jgi:hypothetical protein